MNNRYREEEKNDLENNLEENNEDNLNKTQENTDNIDDKETENQENTDKPVKEKTSKKVKKLEEEIDKLKEENKKLKDQYVRTLADTDNFKKRIDEEKNRDRKYGSQRLLEKLIVSLDIFDIAAFSNSSDHPPSRKNSFTSSTLERIAIILLGIICSSITLWMQLEHL